MAKTKTGRQRAPAPGPLACKTSRIETPAQVKTDAGLRARGWACATANSRNMCPQCCLQLYDASKPWFCTQSKAPPGRQAQQAGPFSPGLQTSSVQPMGPKTYQPVTRRHAQQPRGKQSNQHRPVGKRRIEPKHQLLKQRCPVGHHPAGE